MVTKDELRSWARDATRPVDARSVSEKLVQHLRAFLDPAWTILTYQAMASEPNVANLGHPGPVFVTRTPPQGPLTVHNFACEFEQHPYGYSQPVEGSPEADPRQIDAVLVPGLTFSPDGARLGHGKGYYDRLLTSMRDDCLRIGVVFDGLVVDHLPTEDHDVPMTHLATETGVRVVKGSRD